MVDDDQGSDLPPLQPPAAGLLGSLAGFAGGVTQGTGPVSQTFAQQVNPFATQPVGGGASQLPAFGAAGHGTPGPLGAGPLSYSAQLPQGMAPPGLGPPGPLGASPGHQLGATQGGIAPGPLGAGPWQPAFPFHHPEAWRGYQSDQLNGSAGSIAPTVAARGLRQNEMFDSLASNSFTRLPGNTASAAAEIYYNIRGAGCSSMKEFVERNWPEESVQKTNLYHTATVFDARLDEFNRTSGLPGVTQALFSDF